MFLLWIVVEGDGIARLLYPLGTKVKENNWKLGIGLAKCRSIVSVASTFGLSICMVKLENGKTQEIPEKHLGKA